jgi:aldehyde dehydrogenase (NAD+)
MARDFSLSLLPDIRLIVGDQRVADSSGGEYEHLFAADGQPTRGVVLGGSAEMHAAVEAATRAFPGWRGLRAEQRRDKMLELSRLIAGNAEQLTLLQILESAVPRIYASAFPGIAAEHLAYNAGWTEKAGGTVVASGAEAIDYTLNEPYGVVALLIPWNAALPSLGQLLGPALAAGNTVVLKPSELAPFTSLRIGELACEAGFPPGVLNVVPGSSEGGSALVREPGVHKIHFTGSGSTARKVLAGALENLTPVSLELGGKSALLVFPDADLITAAQQAVSGAVVLSGQGCINGTRVLIHTSVYERFLMLMKGLLRRTIVGDPFDRRTAMGPVINAAACERIVGVIDTALQSGQARLVTGGERMDGALAEGYFIAPTLFADIDNRSDLAQNEIFGPVVACMSFDTEEQAIQLANDTRYGLAAYVHTNDLRRVHRLAERLEAGSLWVNGIASMLPGAPFGGSKQSGYGRLGGLEGIREFSRSKNVWISMQEPAHPNTR